MTVRIRGIYATALTHLLDEVVQPSPAIVDRMEADRSQDPAAASVATTADRQGVRISGEPECVDAVRETLVGVGLDALSWPASLPEGAICVGQVSDTLGSGAILDCGPAEGFLPYRRTPAHVDSGDHLLVQVRDGSAPWVEGRPALDTTMQVDGHLVSLVRDDDPSGSSRQPSIDDIVPAEPPEGWRVRYHAGDDESVGFDQLGAGVEAGSEWATAIDDALSAPFKESEADGDTASASDTSLETLDALVQGASGVLSRDVRPALQWAGLATQFVWFGRQSRFALDSHRRAVAATMPGHHRIKAGTNAASAAVDFVERICPDPSGASEPPETASDDGERTVDLSAPEGAFPFDVLTRQFGPAVGDSVRLAHGKPDGRMFVLGDADVTGREADGTVHVEREMTPGGNYDALGIERQAGDIAETTVKEGRWWYPTVYRDDEGRRRGTYVNICTPVEVFPEAIRYVDLHVDVVKHADGSIERVDDDELDEAVEAGHVSDGLAEKVRRVAAAIEKAL